jgi:hypothetical protein
LNPPQIQVSCSKKGAPPSSAQRVHSLERSFLSDASRVRLVSTFRSFSFLRFDFHYVVSNSSPGNFGGAGRLDCRPVARGTSRPGGGSSSLSRLLGEWMDRRMRSVRGEHFN